MAVVLNLGSKPGAVLASETRGQTSLLFAFVLYRFEKLRNPPKIDDIHFPKSPLWIQLTLRQRAIAEVDLWILDINALLMAKLIDLIATSFITKLKLLSSSMSGKAEPGSHLRRGCVMADDA